MAALLVVAALATAPAASAVVTPPSVGSAQICVVVSGGHVIRMNGFGTSFPPLTTGTTTFNFANGDVVSLEATTDAEGIYHTATFDLDLRDPRIAALVGTNSYETADFAGVQSTLTFEILPCQTTPDGKPACLDGGYLNYPELGFLNQGDCVSWIATNGKNEPGKNVPQSP